MKFETIIFNIEKNLASLTLNRPDRLNSFTGQMHEEIRSAFDMIDQDGSVRCLYITGSGRGFCAGQDLNDRAVKPAAKPRDLSESTDQNYNPLIRRITSLPMPVICAVNGVAAGAGANIAFACDIVFAAKSAKFIQAFCRLGLIPDSGGTYSLPRLIGTARALAITLTGEPIMAEKAENWGMIYKAVEDDLLQEEALKLAAYFTSQPTKGLALIKKAIRASFDHNLDQQLDLESSYQREAGYCEDYKEGVDAFLHKREPKFTGQ